MSFLDPLPHLQLYITDCICLGGFLHTLRAVTSHMIYRSISYTPVLGNSLVVPYLLCRFIVWVITGQPTKRITRHSWPWWEGLRIRIIEKKRNEWVKGKGWATEWTGADVQFKSMCADDTLEAKVRWESSVCVFVLISAQQMCNSREHKASWEKRSQPACHYIPVHLSLSLFLSP